MPNDPEWTKRYRQENKDYFTEYRRRYYEEHKEHIRKTAHERYLRTNGQGRQRMETERTETDFSGIYGLYCLATGQWYVGQSVGVLRRLRQHMKCLITGNHENAKLQDAFTHHGVTAFSMHILCMCPYEELNTKEHEHILAHDSLDNGMNLYLPTPDDM